MHLVDKKIEDYCRAHTSALPKVFDELKEATYSEMKIPQMQVGLLEGRFLSLLVAITGAKRVLEFGTFTGFSSLAMAQSLPEDGRVTTLDVDDRATSMAKRYWAKDPNGKKIELILGPALESLEKLSGPFDLVFMDADKQNYIHYWENVLPKVRRGGLIVVDNVLWSGNVLNPQEKSDHDIVDFNKHARKDPRVEMVMLPVRDGMLLARKL
jgi:caffeoyl-CoA O-methyltransferase